MIKLDVYTRDPLSFAIVDRLSILEDVANNNSNRRRYNLNLNDSDVHECVYSLILDDVYMPFEYERSAKDALSYFDWVELVRYIARIGREDIFPYFKATTAAEVVMKQLLQDIMREACDRTGLGFGQDLEAQDAENLIEQLNHILGGTNWVERFIKDKVY